MRILQLGPNLVQLTRLRVFNCFLVREDDGLTLVDTGLPRSAPAILAAAQRMGAPIVRIALTHAHGDHVGSLDTLAASLPGATVLIGTRESRLLGGGGGAEPGEPQAKLRGSYPRVSTKPAATLEPGQRVGSLEAIASPGHTPGHLALFDVRDRTLIAGDAFSTQGGVAVAGKLRPKFPLPALATWHAPTALESARVLWARQPVRLVVGHGPPLEQPLAAMEEAIAAAS